MAIQLRARQVNHPDAVVMLREVASANMFASPFRRQFTSEDVQRALHGKETLSNLWVTLAAENRLPVVKVLEVDASLQQGLFQL